MHSSSFSHTLLSCCKLYNTIYKGSYVAFISTDDSLASFQHLTQMILKVLKGTICMHCAVFTTVVMKSLA